MRKNKLREVVCEQCGKTTLKGRTGGKRFCNRSCSNIWSHANGGRNVEGIRNLTNSLEGFQQKHGKEAGKKKYDLFVEKMGYNLCHAYGKNYGSYKESKKNKIKGGWDGNEIIEKYKEYKFLDHVSLIFYLGWLNKKKKDPYKLKQG